MRQQKQISLNLPLFVGSGLEEGYVSVLQPVGELFTLLPHMAKHGLRVDISCAPG